MKYKINNTVIVKPVLAKQKSSRKGGNNIFQLGKKGPKSIFRVNTIIQKSIFSANTINSAQFPVSKVCVNPAQTRHSNALSLVHQHGKGSSLVDGNFQYWPSAGASGQNVTPAPATPQQGLGLGQ